uniref:Nitrogen permease regulator 2-like protein n=2 Tax=Cacopsylla melanoneura TaxID=428564 RepID=A0A8D8TTY8_9HEMI
MTEEISDIDRGDIKCIFLCEFHHTAGPTISCQVPQDFISKEVFESVSVYIIPKAQLEQCTITIILDCKILGYPMRIEDNKYARNAFYFNLCVVCDRNARAIQYEPVVQKLSHTLRDLEMESSFLSTQQENPIARARLTNFLNTVMTDLNKNKVCKLTDGTISLYLKVIELRKDPPTVKDWDVPVLTKPYRKIPHEKWDLTTQKVLPFIDGHNHITKISAKADVENNLVKSCVQNLAYYDVIKLDSLFQYSNIYAPTTKIHQLYANRPLQDQCINCIKIKGEEKPIWGDVFRFLCRFNHCNTVKQVCCIVNPATLRFNERKLIQWACLEGFLQRVHKYPVSVCEGTSQSWNGTHCMDEICLALNMSYGKLNDKFEHDPTVSMICK